MSSDAGAGGGRPKHTNEREGGRSMYIEERRNEAMDRRPGQAGERRNTPGPAIAVLGNPCMTTDRDRINNRQQARTHARTRGSGHGPNPKETD